MIVGDNQAVSLHSISGVQLAQFGPSEQASLKWTRSLREVSSCELSTAEPDLLPEVYPWVHWLSVWDLDAPALLWTGPVIKAVASRTSLDISARDIGALLARTRNPLTKRWDSADPAEIAREMWRAMISHHGLNTSPVVRLDPEGDPFDFASSADEATLDTVMSDLVGLGLRWSVVAGVPVLGPMPAAPLAALSEADLIGDGITVVRDGSATANDVLLRGGDTVARTTVPLAGLGLQAIVSADSMFGISNVERALRQYARHTAQIRDSLTLPGGVELHPDAPVSIDELVPSARFTIDARGLRTLMELDSVEVSRGSGSSSVSATFTTVTEVPELAEGDTGAGGLTL
ncbi:minor tail protein [Gordonia phage Ligma]|nr:minor tail protein [Gordonia phage Ligma]UQT02127.1 minor tail protein [Gordonia phage Axumite]